MVSRACGTAFVALALSLAGIYAVVSFGVVARTQEFGIRVALGAAPAQIVRGVVGRAMRVAGIGVALGIALAAATTRGLASQLYGVAPLDLPTFATVTAAIALATLGAAFIPAGRATRVDPAVALRYE